MTDVVINASTVTVHVHLDGPAPAPVVNLNTAVADEGKLADEVCRLMAKHLRPRGDEGGQPAVKP